MASYAIQCTYVVTSGADGRVCGYILQPGPLLDCSPRQRCWVVDVLVIIVVVGIVRAIRRDVQFLQLALGSCLPRLAEALARVVHFRTWQVALMVSVWPSGFWVTLAVL